MAGQSPAIRSLQRGTQSLANTNATNNVTITAVVMAKARVLGGAMGGYTAGSVRVKLTTATNVATTRDTGTSIAFVVPWSVVERY